MTETEKFVRQDLNVNLDSTIRGYMSDHGVQNASLESKLKDVILSLVSKTVEVLSKKEETNVNSKLPQS